MRDLKDRDFLKTPEGFLFCIVGYSHPKDRFISYLKYVPEKGGKWGGADERYTRTMPNYTIPSLLSNIAMLQKYYPQYVFNSRILHIQMSAVPKKCIIERYFPEIRLQVLLNSKSLDALQTRAVELISLLSNEIGVTKDNFGITGSILTGIHNPAFSDIDLIVYGRSNAWRVKGMINEISQKFSLRQYSNQPISKMLERLVKNYPLTIREAKTIVSRRWNYGSFHDKPFSIHAVRKDAEIIEKYGEKHFLPHGIVEGTAEITAIDDSLFLPCTYQVKGLTAQLDNGAVEVDEVVSYDGLYSGLFDCGEQILVKGKLEIVIDRKGTEHYRVLIGSPEAQGKDFIKTLSSITGYL